MTYKTKQEKEYLLNLIKAVQEEGHKVLSYVGHDIVFVEGNYTYPGDDEDVSKEQ